MFENLSSREKYLAWSLIAMVPISLALMVGIWFVQKYEDNNLEIISLTSKISDEENKALLARKALKRLDFYHAVSLPSNPTKYQLWLRDLADRNQFKGSDLKPQSGQIFKYKNKEIGRSQILRLEAEATLEDFTSFIYELYSKQMLQRIKGIQLAPKTGVVNGKRIRTGTIKVNLDIEVAMLNKGDSDFDFETSKIDLPRTLDEYKKAIVDRNIFGPPNNTPIVNVRPSASYASNSEIKITLRGEDGDKDDQLEFSLLKSGIEGAKIEPREGGRDATLILPPTPQGTYSMQVLVKDSGFPPKQSEAEFNVVLKDPPNKKPSVVAKLSNPYPPDRPIEIVLEGSDGDAKDILKFAILEGVEGAEISKQDETDRNPILTIPGLEVGTYPFKVTVSDGREGTDGKVVEKTFEVQVVRKFSHLYETRISNIVRDKSGVWRCDVEVRTTGQRFRLTEGDSFEIEKQTFKVEKIEGRKVIFSVGDQPLTLQLGQPFSSTEQTESALDSKSTGGRG